MSLHSPTSLQEQLLRDEELRLKPYRDSVGKLTIGIGRNLDDVGISREEALSLLAADIKNAEDRIAEIFPWASGLDTPRYSVLVNMTFNMGIGGLAEFRQFLAALQAKDWQRAASEMLDSEWARQVDARAQRLAEQIRTGVWQ